ncbi:MAG: excinuclease ABC subunit C [Acidobacteria bacterium 13_2_20CM_2_57_6]|nr:MAG: excinuclease ABC subunit C [Acidobacteria bacterium 13_2_20CM_2_57_6]PYT40552.1 MAG: excinuclease ABC subunit C [Acidobacteriota bacterium]PYT46675.1 MAG: excinuclease ABC subunit C [Acidobacteriota bacterium]PYT54852.1 MAG: excinuclease ABC subunit C [Acidobacteriota bacterium]
MEPREKAAQLPESPGVYLFKDAGEKILYVGKARNLRSRVRSYFLESRWIDAKTGSLAREIADLETILVGNEREALALEHNLIKQYRPKFNVVLRDDKTYPYIKFTAAEKYPRLYFTRRIKKDGSLYFGPYFPASLARRILHFVHKRFLVPSCTVDLTRSHPRPCLQYYIKRCLGPCVAGLTTDERYAEAARDVRLFLEGRRHDLIKSLEERMTAAAEKELFEQAAAYRDLLRTLEDIEERQRIAAAQGDDTDVLAYYAEPPLVAADLFHLRGGRVVDRREFYWEDLEEFDPQEFVPSLLKQLYLEAEYLPKAIHVSADFEDRELLEATLTERAGHKVEIFTPQRGTKRAFLDLVENNAKHSFEQRFRVLKPTSKAIGEALQNALNLAEEPQRIESFDISHIQGTDTVASMVVWEKGRMKKSDYRKFIIRGDEGSDGNPLRQNDDFASMREAVTRRYRRLQEEKKELPGLILIDGGIGQLHAAAQALESLQIINQPVASIAKKEEILYVLGQEDEPIVLERHSPVLHLIQQIRDETHRFAITFHRQRRGKRQTQTALGEIPGVGLRTAQKLLKEFGSVANIQRAGLEKLSGVISRKSAEKILSHLGDSKAQ